VARLGPWDRLLLGGALLLWGVAFAAHGWQLARGRIGFVPFYVEGAADPGSLPKVIGLWPHESGPPTPLRVGDRIARVGERDARGMGRVRLLSSLFAAADRKLDVPLELERDGARTAATVALQPVAYPWLTPILSLSFAAIGTLALRRGASPVRRAFFLGGVAYGLHWTAYLGGGPLHTAFVMALTALAPAVAAPMTLRTVLLFPSEVARRSRAARIGPWLLAANGLFVFAWAYGFPLPPDLARPLALGGTLVFLAAVLGFMLAQYRRAGAGGRRQLRWALLGLYVGLTGPALLAGVALAVPPLWWAYHVSLAAVIAVPIGLFIGLDRHHLLDVDRLIGAAASYSALLGGGLALLLGAAPSAAGALSEAAQLDPRASQTILAAVLGLAMIPAHRALRPRLERLLFRERHALESGLGRLQRDLGACEKAEEVFDRLASGLEELLHPDVLALYGHVDAVYAPLVARGRAIAPAFDAAGALPSLLEHSGGTLDVARLRRRSRGGSLGPAERAALDAMGVQLVVPLALDEELVAFLCLGEKESGDIYTETDRALLQALADRVGVELRRFGEEATRKEERAMMVKLRRYVPGSIAEEIEEGGTPEEGEREVTVLFVDVRGYTSFAQDKAAPEIFASVNRYTRAVSEAVRAQGGTIVEFNGDGMMTVFGAPRALPHKEGAAVRAARQIARAVSALELEDGAAAPSFAVGIGVATGPAFVGSIRAADRAIWSAIGNTTNLAARLERLTRDLDVAIALDAVTHERAGHTAAGFEAHREVRIRGRSEPVDVFTLRQEALEGAAAGRSA
jgi:adenylate cyclase